MQSVVLKKMHQSTPGASYTTVRSMIGAFKDAFLNVSLTSWPVLALLVLSLLLPARGIAQPAAKPVRELANLTLLEGEAGNGPSFETVLWAALDIKLAPKVKTYWRTVGDSGLPPVFSWAGSINLQKIDVLWPAPVRFSDGSGTSIGYHDRVVLPLKVMPLDPMKPVTLKLSLDYAVCETLCMPAHFNGSLTLQSAKTATGSQRILDSRRAETLALITAFQERVPVPVERASQTPLALLAITGEGNSLIVATRWPAPSGIGDVFIEGPDGWVFATPQLQSQQTDSAGFLLATYRVAIDERPSKDSSLASVALTATLVSPTMAIETRVTLDKSGQAP